jgi:hypothetical protein
MLNISVQDDRVNVNYPQLPTLDVEAVVKAAGIDTVVNDLSIKVLINDNPDRKLETTYAAPESTTNLNSWMILLNIMPRDTLSYGAARAINRGIARSVFAISAIRTYGTEMVGVMYSPEDFAKAATKFAAK